MTHVAVSRSAEILLSPLLRRECIKNTLRICRKTGKRAERTNATSCAQFAALPLVKPVVWFARAVVNWHSRFVAKSGVPGLMSNSLLFCFAREKRQFRRRLKCLPVITWDPRIKLKKIYIIRIYPLQDVTHGNIEMQKKITLKWIVLWRQNQLVMIPGAAHHLWFAVGKKEERISYGSVNNFHDSNAKNLGMV